MYSTSTVPIDPMLTIFPTLGQYRLVKFPIQGGHFYVKPCGYTQSPLGKTIDWCISLESRRMHLATVNVDQGWEMGKLGGWVSNRMFCS